MRWHIGISGDILPAREERSTIHGAVDAYISTSIARFTVIPRAQLFYEPDLTFQSWAVTTFALQLVDQTATSSSFEQLQLPRIRQSSSKSILPHAKTQWASSPAPATSFRHQRSPPTVHQLHQTDRRAQSAGRLEIYTSNVWTRTTLSTA